jgi:hypothetical protein
MYRFSGGRFGSTPPVTKNLIIINVVMLLGTMVLQQTGVNLNALLGMYYFQSPLFAPWQIVTHMFMHGGIGHIFFNMYALWIFGKTLESVWGSKRFLIYYLATGLGAAFFHQLVNYIQFAPDIAALKAAYSVDGSTMPCSMRFCNQETSFMPSAGTSSGRLWEPPVLYTECCWHSACYSPIPRSSCCSFPFPSRPSGWSLALVCSNYTWELPRAEETLPISPTSVV